MKHHAVCYINEVQAHNEIGHFFQGNDPDVHCLTYTDFGIADARELTRRSHMTPLSASEHVFVVTCKSLTHEAQNALLKLFEEPPPRTQFYLLVPQRGILLLTLQSRLMIIEAEESAEALNKNVHYETFKGSSYGERMELVAALCKANDSDGIEAILAGVEHEVVGDSSNAVRLRSLLMTRENISRRGASKKMLLESLALSVPHR